MVMQETVDRIRYPDDFNGMHFDALEYEEAVESLKIGLRTATGQLKEDLQETLDEIQRRWITRQANAS